MFGVFTYGQQVLAKPEFHLSQASVLLPIVVSDKAEANSTRSNLEIQTITGNLQLSAGKSNLGSGI